MERSRSALQSAEDETPAYIGPDRGGQRNILGRDWLVVSRVWCCLVGFAADDDRCPAGQRSGWRAVTVKVTTADASALRAASDRITETSA